MRFTESKFDPDEMKVLVAEKTANLRDNRGTDDLLGFGLSIVRDRLKKNPLRYRDYGPYWWALKDALRRAGFDYGPQSDPLVVDEYRGFSDVETLVMADEFRSLYLKTSIILTNKFALDRSGEWYALLDPDIEELLAS